MSDVIVAFDDFIHGATTAYSSSFFNALLGEVQTFAIEAVAEGMSGSPTTTIAIQLETSGDGRNWTNKNPSAELSLSVAASATTTAVGYEVNTRPGAALVRLRLDTSGGPGTPGVKVVISIRGAPDSKLTPARFPGCVLWLRSDLGVTLQGANAVSTWADQSGNGNHVTQSTGANQPLLVANSLNGLPTINFDGVNDVLATAAFALGTYTVLLVTTGQNGTNGWFWVRGAPVDTLYGTTSTTIYAQRGAVISGWELTASWGQWGASTGKVVVVRFDGTNSGHQLRINGVDQTLSSGTGNNPGTSTTTDVFSIGARSDSALPSKINVAEVALFNSSLSIQQLAALEEYVRRRYALY